MRDELELSIAILHRSLHGAIVNMPRRDPMIHQFHFSSLLNCI